MSLHKLTAGSGYDYLTRQVAALDATEKGHTGLASYYTERGESPGVWVGSGMDGIDGLHVGDPVTAEQMRALFGCGLHPLAEERQRQLQGPDLTELNFQDASRLGAPFKVFDGATPFRIEVAKRIAVLQTSVSEPGNATVTAADRARIRTEVGREFFMAEHHRAPADARELAGQIAKDSRPRAQAAAGFDLTFSPVKSVSALWAVAEPGVAAAIERAQQSAVQDALTFIELQALFTRTGPQGIRQVNVRGLVAAAFTHRDSRAGDPDLHTHVAVANKVQTLDGRWLSIDGRMLFKANVAASETYNTALEQHLHATLGVRFAERPGTDPGKRPIREIVGVDPRLNQRWSSRRAYINVRRGELAVQFQTDHGRPPTPVEALHLAQQATLETRDAKHQPRSLAEQRATWAGEAAAVLGGPRAVSAMVQSALTPRGEPPSMADAQWLSRAGDRVLNSMEETRATWQIWHVRAEAQRQVRTVDVAAKQSNVLVELLVDEVLKNRSVALVAPKEGMEEPKILRRADGASVYSTAGADVYTSHRILDAEQRLIDVAGWHDGSIVERSAVDLVLLEMAANGTALDTGQASLVRQMCTSGARLQLAIAPAGTGKTMAMRALALAWTQDGGQVIGLAPSAAAAAVLGEQTGIRADTLTKLTWSIQHNDLPDWAAKVGPSTLIIIDEAGMANTLSLDTAVHFAIHRGASVRLVGDDQQLAAIGAGGVLRDIKHTHGALHLTELHRFINAAEAQASLALREGDPNALGFYLNHGRVHVGDVADTSQDAFKAWVSDRAAGLDAIMLAPTRELVADLNRRARQHRLGDTNPGREVGLGDGNQASIGDVIITRTNDRRLRLSATDWVKNGDRWTVTHVGKAGDLRVRHRRTHLTTRLPAAYVAASTGLGYATTIHTAQGVSADTMHGLLTGRESRRQLYTMLTRGRHANHLYLQTVGDGDLHSLVRPETVAPHTPTEMLQQILARDDAPTSATSQLRDLNDPATRLYDAVQRYTDSLHVAAEQIIGPEALVDLDRADRLIPGITNEPAWPSLRAHLLLATAETGRNPLFTIEEGAAGRDMRTAGDMAAVLYWRLTGTTHQQPGPLPWLPAIPTTLRQHPEWGDYLTARGDRVAQLAQRVNERARQRGDQPAWAPPSFHPDVELVADIAVWRAANGIDPGKTRPTGGTQAATAASRWKQRLDRDVLQAMGKPGDAVGSQPTSGRPGPGHTHISDIRERNRSRPIRPFAPGR